MNSPFPTTAVATARLAPAAYSDRQTAKIAAGEPGISSGKCILGASMKAVRRLTLSVFGHERIGESGSSLFSAPMHLRYLAWLPKRQKETITWHRPSLNPGAEFRTFGQIQGTPGRCVSPGTVQDERAA
jgi:hypothetical protein